MAGSDRLDPDKIKAYLKAARIGRRIVVYDATGSTNDVAAEYAKSNHSDGLVVFAEQQTAGRGRSGARWFSERGQSILCSIVLAPCQIGGELLSLTCAVAVAEVVDRIRPGRPVRDGLRQCHIKWPNDILLNGRKVGGILIESKQSPAGNAYIVGIGINCHQDRAVFPAEIQAIATSIDMEGPAPCDRTRLAAELLSAIDHWLTIAEKDPGSVAEMWKQFSSLVGQRITLSYNGRSFRGHCIGVDPDKGLLVQLDSGGVRLFDAAHSHIAR